MHGSSTSSNSNIKKSEKDSKGNQKSGKGGEPFVGSRKTYGQVGMEAPKVNPLLASLVNPDPIQTQAILRKELLLARSFKGSQIHSAESKHYYGIDTQTILSTEISIPICRVVGGTASNTRTTNTIRLKGTKLRFLCRRTPTATGSAAALVPTLTFVIWRDKIPATVGSIPTILGTDANPPASTTLMLSRLGQAGVVYNSVAVRNPITDLDYHIYEVHHKDLVPENYDFVTPASAFGLPAPQVWKFDFHLDLHRVVQTYASYTATDPDVNAVYCTFYSNLDYTGQGYTDILSWTVDTEFEDVQDGE